MRRLQSHPWWRHVPRSERGQRKRQIRLLRLRAWWDVRGNRIRLMLVIYLLFCLWPTLIGQPHLSGFALLPVLLVPPLGYLVYALAWHEFHR
ncbi:MAG: hypothetical protein VKI83_01040 [Synechococcaceae cyanobacterium]|nr:hypothetical protein [Synechococcaceae cyanobacterium]